ncbi:S8 family serine peptidase [Paenibacillus sp. GCM10028914]|uniref:S8 family serine peptidase n=1 Tax=Paenibacillus sp. GCM10028914 TaxID=3273416 RepID=UPI003616CA95
MRIKKITSIFLLISLFFGMNSIYVGASSQEQQAPEQEQKETTQDLKESKQKEKESTQEDSKAPEQGQEESTQDSKTSEQEQKETTQDSKTPEQGQNEPTQEPKSSSQVNEYIVSFKNGDDPLTVLKKNKILKKEKKKLKKHNISVIALSTDEVERLKKDSSVEFVEPNAKVSINGIIAVTGGAITDAEINNEEVPWGNVAIGSHMLDKQNNKGKGIKVAVLDTGVSNHPDLRITGGINIVNGTSNYVDDNGHGTHVAGTIAALENNQGIVGIAPNADLYSVKVLGSDGTGTYTQVIEGIQWAIDHKMDIISMSFTGAENSEALHKAIKEAEASGIILVAAAGNKGLGKDTVMYPASYPEVISVGATTKSNDRANLSSTGENLDIVAPGVDIRSTTKNGSYGNMSGTSMAVPHVVGAAAVIWSENKTSSAREIRELMMKNATSIEPKQEYGNGLLNLAKSLGIIDSELPPFQQDYKDETEPGQGGNGEISIAAIERGSIAYLDRGVPTPPSGYSSWTKLNMGVDSTTGRVCSGTFSGPFKAGQTAPNPPLACDTSNWSLGTYEVKYTYYYPDGTYSMTPEIFTVTPEAPTGLTASKVTQNSLLLSWNPVKDVTTYKILVNGQLHSNTTSTSKKLTNLTPNTAYSIRIKAVDPTDPNAGATSPVVNLTTDGPGALPRSIPLIIEGQTYNAYPYREY